MELFSGKKATVVAGAAAYATLFVCVFAVSLIVVGPLVV